MNIKDFSQPTILSGKQYGTTVTIELDHSDTSIDEVMDGMLTIVKGLGYLEGTINEWIKDKSKDIYEDEYDIISKSLADDWFDEMDEELPTECWCGDRDRCDCISQPNDNDEYSDDDSFDWDEERIDIIGQNGNEGTHYGLATDEDIEECELNELGEDYEGQFQDWERETPTDEYDDYGQRIEKERPHFEWGDEPEEDDDEDVDPLFDGEEFKPNQKLKMAAQRYSDEVRAKHTPIKLDKSKVKRGKIKDLKK